MRGWLSFLGALILCLNHILYHLIASVTCGGGGSSSEPLRPGCALAALLDGGQLRGAEMRSHRRK